MGPRIGDYALKPDIAAPGVDILAARAGGTADTGWYATMSGSAPAHSHRVGSGAPTLIVPPGRLPPAPESARAIRARVRRRDGGFAARGTVTRTLAPRPRARS